MKNKDVYQNSKELCNELRELSLKHDIAIITAQQIPREGASNRRVKYPTGGFTPAQAQVLIAESNGKTLLHKHNSNFPTEEITKEQIAAKISMNCGFGHTYIPKGEFKCYDPETDPDTSKALLLPNK